MTSVSVMCRAGGPVDEALAQAQKSPCCKSHRGVVLYHGQGRIVGRGYNAQPEPFVCDGSEECRVNCGKLCVHAEAAAIRDAGDEARGADLVHVKEVRGVLAVSGPPSCWQCSREILGAGVARVWLFHADGWSCYSATEFHDRTLHHCSLLRSRAHSA